MTQAISSQIINPVFGVENVFHDKFAAMQLAATQNPYPSEETRRRRLNKAIKLLKDNQAQIATAINDDFGQRSAYETRLLEIFPSVECARLARRKLHKWMKPKKEKVSMWFQPGSARTVYQPLGVVGIISPWNYPLFLTMAPMIGAIAAGNLVMLKLSEHTPHFARCFSALIPRYFSEDEVYVVNGGADVAQQFCALAFDHLLFTGSTSVGKQVMRTAAENLTPVTLELGGKSPTIIAGDCNFKKAATRTLVGKLLNAGQTCVAPDYVLLPIAREEDFVSACKAAAQKLYPQGGGKDYSHIINEHQLQRLQALLRDAEEKGARIEKLFAQDDDGRCFVPRMVLGCTEDMRIMQEEIFGPLLPVMAYRALVDAIAYINERPRPLALYYYGEHSQDVDTILYQTHSGGVTINDVMMHVGQENLPFGGIGASGMGRYHGHQGFLSFSHTKAVFLQSSFNFLPLIYPPFNKLTDLILRLMIR